MDLTDSQAALVRYVTAEFVRRRQLTGQPIPLQVHQLLAAVSVRGTAPKPVEQDSTPDELIDTSEAAQIIGCSTRRIRRIATDLDGEQIADRWVFRRSVVTEYSHLKQGA